MISFYIEVGASDAIDVLMKQQSNDITLEYLTLLVISSAIVYI